MIFGRYSQHLQKLTVNAIQYRLSSKMEEGEAKYLERTCAYDCDQSQHFFTRKNAEEPDLKHSGRERLRLLHSMSDDLVSARFS